MTNLLDYIALGTIIALLVLSFVILVVLVRHTIDLEQVSHIPEHRDAWVNGEREAEVHDFSKSQNTTLPTKGLSGNAYNRRQTRRHSQ